MGIKQLEEEEDVRPGQVCEPVLISFIFWVNGDNNLARMAIATRQRALLIED